MVCLVYYLKLNPLTLSHASKVFFSPYEDASIPILDSSRMRLLLYRMCIACNSDNVT